MENINHIAIILDGNGRWATAQGLPRNIGHKAGAETLEKLAKEADKLKLKYLTVYAFSTENWKRSKVEVDFLMRLFKIYFNKISKDKNHNIKVKFFSSRDTLDQKYIDLINGTEEATKNNTGLQLNICFNYGGRLEIVEAAKKIFSDINDKKLELEDINEELFSNYLYSAGIPDPDLIIRTSGELRLSNFLLWQMSYSELLFIDKNWPDFTIEDLKNAVKEYNKRNRTFGKK